MEPMTLKLTKPLRSLEDENIVYEVLTFKELTGKDLRGVAAQPDYDDLLNLVSKSTGLTHAEVNRLSFFDANQAAKMVGNFFLSGPKTGE